MEAVMQTGLTQEMLSKLFGILKGWAEDMEAFRYEMFARRLVAAEFGRPDAVQWALDWHADVVAEERQAEEERQRASEAEARRRKFAKAELYAGRCGNPQYQAFLDTVEHPETVTNHVAYMAWISELLTAFEGIRGIKDLPADEQRAIWQRMIQEKRDANLAPRLAERCKEAR